ncbi:MAG: (4Fe-4S)-binding protein [Chitinophagales bacterium]|nr:(4Fe-4S)-binding protein [Chitinophagaceae bacterium]MCB9063930.1 (4Fe-4S)-binding protein [Chitinophagales bacterium]
MDPNNIKKEYSNGEVTVVWQSGLCIHSKNCWTGLISVFNPKNRPWINMDGADTATIMAQVEKCPSGALSYYKNEEQQEAKSEQSDIKVEVTKNGPYLVHGEVTIQHKDGTKERKKKVTALCRCGQSNNKPFCDGTHRKCGFKDE